MKTLKKIMAFAVCLVMALAMTVTVFADDYTPDQNGKFKITAPANTHQYEIYQIFTGEVSAAGVLSDVKWGINGTGYTKGSTTAVSSDVLDELKAVNSKTDREKLDVIEKYADLDTPVDTISNGSEYLADPGYYLIKDKAVTGNDVYTTYIVRVVGNITITTKSDVPTVEKKVQDINDSTDQKVNDTLQDSADYDIGDDVPFTLTGTVAANFADYKQYYYAFHDTAEEGLTYHVDSLKVYKDSVDDSNLIPTDSYVVSFKNTAEESGKGYGYSLDIVFNNLKNVSGINANSKIIVTYTAQLNEKATIGKHGNINGVKLTYSNNPNADDKGNSKPDDDNIGETPVDNVIVFTYQVTVHKTDGTNPLAGAAFKLEKVMQDNSKKTIKEFTAGADTSFTFKGLDDGTYILTETTTPSGYNSIDPITFKVEAEHTAIVDPMGDDNRDDVLTSLTGTKQAGEITLSSDADKNLSTDIVNKSGSVLPSTGGIGTRIFYLIGGILMAGAAIVLITKVRFNKNK